MLYPDGVWRVTWHLVVWVAPGATTIDEIGIYSEASPTMRLGIERAPRPYALASVHGTREHAERALRAWCARRYPGLVAALDCYLATQRRRDAAVGRLVREPARALVV